MKGKNRLWQWQIVTIIILVFGFSFLCWREFLKKTDWENLFVPEEEIMNGIETFDAYMEAVDDAWYECIFRKKYLNAIHSMFTYYVLREVPDEKVILGKNNWLFYHEKKERDSLADFEGSKPYTAEEKEEILYVVRENQRQMEEKGIKSIILVAPNKENVYAEYMPDRYLHSEKSNTDEVVEYLQENGIAVVSSKSEMLKLCHQRQLYYPYDSHWNQLGAYVGVKSVLDVWGIEAEELLEREIRSYPLKENYHEGAWSDLANMGGLNFLLDDETEYELTGTIQIDWGLYAFQQYAKEVSHFYNENALSDDTLFLIGDSFRTAMIPALNEIYREVAVIHRSDYQPHMLEEVKPDCVIMVYVERYASEMKELRIYSY